MGLSALSSALETRLGQAWYVEGAYLPEFGIAKWGDARL